MKDTHAMFVTEWALDRLPHPASEAAGKGAPVELPAPRTSGGHPLLDALQSRQSCRDFRPDPLPEQVLSDLLWCAFGVNRPAIHGRTAPSAQNWQEVDLYVARADGLFLFEPASHRLINVAARDIRAMTGLQPFAGTVPVNLVYVADFGRATDATEEEMRLYCVANAAVIAQNVYLFCASQGLGTVVRGAIDRPLLGVTMGLDKRQQIILAQSVGYPANRH